MERKSPRLVPRKSQAGMTLIETAIALVVLFIATAGLMALGVVATMTTENQGHLAARTTEYAQDKMEQLISLSFCDGLDGTVVGGGSDTTVFPATSGGGTGLAVGGSSNPNAAVDGYVDYLDANGNPLGGGAAPPPNWYYVRVWQIDTPACAPPANYCNPPPDTFPPAAGFCTLKQITVTSKVRFGVGAVQEGALAQSSLSILKTHPF